MIPAWKFWLGLGILLAYAAMLISALVFNVPSGPAGF